MANTFTKTQFFTAIATGTLADGMTKDDVVAFANHELELLANRANKAKEARAAKAKAPDEMMETLYNALTDEFQTTGDIVVAIGDEAITASKATYRLNALVDLGRAVKEDIKVEGSKRTRKGYRRA